jgi:hypothetical protein
MSLVSIDFQELYGRHLCRHSQFGINVAHLLALFGVWFGVYGFLYWLFPTPWVPIGLAAAYLGVVALHAPVRVSVACAVFLALFVTAVLFVPPLPFWAYLVMIPVFYKLQAWSHKVWTVATDMTEFNKKYTKGYVLFVILLAYEIPFLLNYLVFDTKRWAGASGKGL